MTRKKKPTASLVRSSAAEYLTFVAATGSQQQAVEMRYEDENIWLSQKMMATLYDVTVPAINQHLERIFADCELAPDAVIRQLLTTAADGKTYNVKHYAVRGQTAAEVIVDRADAKQPHMGLTTWEGAPKGKIHRYDVVIAKNYLSATEMDQMQRIVSAYLDMAEMQATRRIPMTMADWETRLAGFLRLWDREILQDAGKVSAELAKQHALTEFEKYRIVQDRLFESDFDRVVAETKRLGEGAAKPAPAKPKRGKKP